MKRLLFLFLLCAAAARGQEEPSPFWAPPPPPAKTKKKKPPVQVEPLEIKRKKPPPRAERKKPAPPPPARKVPPPAPKEEARTPEPTWIVPPARAAPPPPVRPVEPVPAPAASAPPAVIIPAAPAPAPAARLPPAVIVPPPPSPKPEPQPEPEEAELERPASPRWGAAALAGLWGKSRSDGSGRLWNFTYGLRFSCAILRDRLELELLAARAGSSAGSPFVNASVAHNLFALRAFWVLGPPRLSLLLGAGAGATWAQTHYALADVGGTPSGLDANSVKPVIEITAAARARIIRGLEARVEVSGLLRSGAVEPLPLVGLGAAF